MPTQQPSQVASWLIDSLVAVGLVASLGVVFAIDLVTGALRKPTMEVVFILDEGTGLAESADQLKKNWLKIARSINEQGFDCRFAVIPCHPKSEQIPNVSLTADLAEVERRLTDTAPASGELANNWPETDCLKGLEDVLNLEFRAGASPVVFLTTNARIKDETRLARIAERYRERRIKTIIQADESQQPSFRPVSKNGGQFFTLIDGRDLTEPSEEKADKASAAVGSILASINKGTSNKSLQTVNLFFGVKVKGRIALVCDTSGSMAEDFPPLVRELREKFAKDTPLILVEGCHFAPPTGLGGRPTKLGGGGGSVVFAVDFSNDPHVYRAANTTDAILYAVEELKRDTVMFNNDLQDSGSLQAIAAFEELLKRRRFTLSGRSLNCDAPDILKEFIRKTDGDFKLDPINRQKSPAAHWSP